MLRWRATCTPAHQVEEPLPRRRRRAQLRGQRPHPARGSVRADLDPAGRRRRRRRARRRAVHLASAARQPAGDADGGHATGLVAGPEYGDDPRFGRSCDRLGAVYEDSATTTRSATHVADLLANEKVVGWFQGRMEFGPRALGARSIIGDARSPTMQSRDEPEDQVPRVVPARSRRRCSRSASTNTSRCGPARTAPTCCWSRRCQDRSGATSNGRRRRLRGIDKLKAAALDDPGGHPRRLLGARADRRSRSVIGRYYRAAQGVRTRRPAAR